MAVWEKLHSFLYLANIWAPPSHCATQNGLHNGEDISSCFWTHAHGDHNLRQSQISTQISHTEVRAVKKIKQMKEQTILGGGNSPERGLWESGVLADPEAQKELARPRAAVCRPKEWHVQRSWGWQEPGTAKDWNRKQSHSQWDKSLAEKVESETRWGGEVNRQIMQRRS